MRSDSGRVWLLAACTQVDTQTAGDGCAGYGMVKSLHPGTAPPLPRGGRESLIISSTSITFNYILVQKFVP